MTLTFIISVQDPRTWGTYIRLIEKIHSFDPHLGGESMATNPLGKRNSIMGGLNHPLLTGMTLTLIISCQDPLRWGTYISLNNENSLF